MPPLRKRRKLSPSEEEGCSVASAHAESNEASIQVDSFLQNAARWNLEQSYETRPRKLKGKKENGRLPIKTEDGRLEQVEGGGQSDREGSEPPRMPEESTYPEASKSQAPAIVDHRSASQIIREAQEEMAKVASLINQDPEEYIGRLKSLAELTESPNLTVKKLALATQLAIFKDIIPGYRIRSLSNESVLEKVSKEVRRLRAFEQSLVSSYSHYVQCLTAEIRARGKEDLEQAEVSRVALSCACALVVAAPHFNNRDDLLKALVERISRRKVDEGHRKCVSCLEQLFREDEDGLASQAAVAMMTKMMKARDYDMDESVLHTFLCLRLLNEFSSKASSEKVDGNADKAKGNKSKQPHQFRTKRQRKELKELKAVEKEFREADASVQREAREHAQAETLKLVFGAYFRVLKTRSPRLMGAVLEGLARYAHLINQEFFGDLLVTLQELANDALASLDVDMSDDADPNGIGRIVATSNPGNTDTLRAALLCTTTAFALLSAQEAASLKLDLSSFATILYTLLIPLSLAPDIELTSKTPRLPDPYETSGDTPAISVVRAKVHATALSTLLMRALASALTPRHTPPVRLAAFTHRLMMASLHVPERTAVAILTLLSEIATSQGRKIRGLWTTEEQRGDGRFEPLAGIEACRPFCGTLWEGELLRLHYAEGVRKGLGELEKLVNGMA